MAYILWLKFEAYSEKFKKRVNYFFCFRSIPCISNIGDFFQAASDGLISSAPNPIPVAGGDGDLGGREESEEARNLRAGVAPPPRPPPPAAGQSGPGGKTALDDLNDSIRVAMGSPSRPPPPASQPVAVIAGGVPGAQPIMQTYPPLQQQLYGSPIKFPPGPPGK